LQRVLIVVPASNFHLHHGALPDRVQYL
jgi:hypothetical protein